MSTISRDFLTINLKRKQGEKEKRLTLEKSLQCAIFSSSHIACLFFQSQQRLRYSINISWGRHMIRIKKNIGREKFFHLGHQLLFITEGGMKLFYLFMYLFIYVYPYRIPVYYFKGGRSIRIFQSPWGGGGKSVDTNKNAIGGV